MSRQENLEILRQSHAGKKEEGSIHPSGESKRATKRIEVVTVLELVSIKVKLIAAIVFARRRRAEIILRRVNIAVLILLSITIFSPCVRVKGSNQAPVASFTYSPAIPYAQEIITFDASASYDPDGSVVSYQWDFGDGNVATLATPVITHDYLDCGNYIAISV